jgi:hypothetical protein
MPRGCQNPGQPTYGMVSFEWLQGILIQLLYTATEPCRIFVHFLLPSFHP